MTRGPKVPELAREMAAEFAGTMILILFGCGVVAQVIAAGGLGDPQSLGDHDSIAWAWGIGVTLGVYTSARISGGHINPAVTLAFAFFKGFPWRKVLPYAIAQTAGAFVGALIVRWNYSEVLQKFDPGLTEKSHIVFSTMPGNGTLPIGTWPAFRDQVIGTAILLFLVMALIDLRNAPPLSNLAPFIIGLIVVGIGMSYGALAGYAINPARDLGPRLVQWLTGYGDAWSDQFGNLYFWVPIAGPLLGGVIGAGLYVLLVGLHTPDEDGAAEVIELEPEKG
ncbi:MIP/aquaporin family protein [Actinomadura sp. 7K507]|uniref:MIP/aquaporin family protein n=1 Tax=Actinomadura sp. 7K507 TaxID=2530365 RepID=UPI001FB7716B|nr:MIP/aquaporin family protein [Actinomadura sp. 7K507]